MIHHDLVINTVVNDALAARNRDLGARVLEREGEDRAQPLLRDRKVRRPKDIAIDVVGCDR